jgi:LPXTG-motif cell wall-anchored protein
VVPKPGVASVTGTPLCANGTGTINLTLGNIAGDLAVVFVVTHPSTAVSTTVTVGKMSNQQFTLLGTGPGTVQVTIKADGTDMSRAFEVTCPVVVVQPDDEDPIAPQVLASGVSSSSSSFRTLPATGRNSTQPFTILAAGLLGAGFLALRTSRRRS